MGMVNHSNNAKTSIVFSIVGIASGLLHSIITLIIYGVIVYYMYRPEDKSYFGEQKLSLYYLHDTQPTNSYNYHEVLRS